MANIIIWMILLMIFINKSVFLALIICISIPFGLLANDSKPDTQTNEIKTSTPYQSGQNKSLAEKKKILTADRDLGPFFLIGLIINLIMMTSFGIWAYGQFQQNNKKKKK